MMAINQIVCLSIILILLIGCQKDTERLDNYYVDLITVKKTGEHYRFELDNGSLLIPKETNYNGVEGQRAILNYVPLIGDTIKVNSIANIFTGEVDKESTPENLIKDPIKMQSVWVGGNYLNMVIETYFHSEPHKVALFQFQDINSTTAGLYFSHSKEEDPLGYPQIMYLSFLISSIREEDRDYTPFKLFINTFDGQREISLILK